jgi:hypothetical protein
VLINVRTGEIKPAAWSNKQTRTVRVDLRDTVMAIADASYLDWPVAPEAPWRLVARKSDGEVQLKWQAPGMVTGFEIQRSSDWGIWQKVAERKPEELNYSEKLLPGRHISYRVRALGEGTPSAWSNPAWVDGERER